jgi:hypothetical protein
MFFSTYDTLYIFVTCCREQTRRDMLYPVVADLNQHSRSFNFADDLIVFDSGSVYDETDKLLKTVFSKVFKSKENYGYWSALNWIFDNHEVIMGRKYKYCYVIESDFIHYNMHSLIECERAFNYHDSIHSIRVQKFSVQNRRLYDKDCQSNQSDRCNWVRQINSFQNGAPVEFKQLFYLGDCTYSPKIYASNFVAKIPAVNKMEIMQSIFSKLSLLESFDEMKFQSLYYDVLKEKYGYIDYNSVAVLDGGIYDTFLAYQKDVITGSFSMKSVQDNVGYIPTRNGKIITSEHMIVDSL